MMRANDPDKGAVITGKLPADISLGITPPRDQRYRTVGPGAGIEGGIQGTVGIQPRQIVTASRIIRGKGAADENLAIGLGLHGT